MVPGHKVLKQWRTVKKHDKWPAAAGIRDIMQHGFWWLTIRLCALLTLRQDTTDCLILHTLPSAVHAGTADNILGRCKDMWLHYSHQIPCDGNRDSLWNTVEYPFTLMVTQEDFYCSRWSLLLHVIIGTEDWLCLSEHTPRGNQWNWSIQVVQGERSLIVCIQNVILIVHFHVVLR
jgi:hypothetical protein